MIVNMKKPRALCSGLFLFVGEWVARFVGYWLIVVVRIDCIQLNTATADSWSRLERGNALGAIRGLDRAVIVSDDCIFAPD